MVAKLSPSSTAIGSAMRVSCRVRTMLPLLPLDVKRTHDTLRSPRELTRICDVIASILVSLGSALEDAIEVGLRPRPATVPTSLKALADGVPTEPPGA